MHTYVVTTDWKEIGISLSPKTKKKTNKPSFHTAAPPREVDSEILAPIYTDGGQFPPLPAATRNDGCKQKDMGGSEKRLLPMSLQEWKPVAQVSLSLA